MIFCQKDNIAFCQKYKKLIKQDLRAKASVCKKPFGSEQGEIVHDDKAPGPDCNYLHWPFLGAGIDQRRGDADQGEQGGGLGHHAGGLSQSEGSDVCLRADLRHS